MLVSIGGVPILLEHVKHLSFNDEPVTWNLALQIISSVLKYPEYRELMLQHEVVEIIGMHLIASPKEEILYRAKQGTLCFVLDALSLLTAAPKNTSSHTVDDESAEHQITVRAIEEVGKLGYAVPLFAIIVLAVDECGAIDYSCDDDSDRNQGSRKWNVNILLSAAKLLNNLASEGKAFQGRTTLTYNSMHFCIERGKEFDARFCFVPPQFFQAT
jgi:hypothetical protein